MKLRRSAVVALVGLSTIVATCGGGGGMVVEDAWGRSSPSSADAAAFYVTVKNDTGVPDRLAAASSDRCTKTEVHESSMDANGVMKMRPADPAALNVPAGGELQMAPGGLHVMCMGLTAPLGVGETVRLELVFEGAGAVTVDVRIEDR